MNPRERLLVALDGGTPDRVPCALSFYSVDLRQLVPPDLYRPDWVDVHDVPFPLSPEEEALRERIASYGYDTRLGTLAQAATYARAVREYGSSVNSPPQAGQVRRISEPAGGRAVAPWYACTAASMTRARGTPACWASRRQSSYSGMARSRPLGNVATLNRTGP